MAGVTISNPGMGEVPSGRARGARSSSRIPLDAIDVRMLGVLQRDGRISKTALGAAVGLSASACLERLRRLEREKLIVGYHAMVNLKALAGLHTFTPR